VWPYNSITNRLAFLVAEPDFLLRRVNGHVRVELRGSSAKAVAALHLGGGDTVALSLEGVDWSKDDSSVRGSRARVEWQLQFTEKLRLEVCILGYSSNLASSHFNIFTRLYLESLARIGLSISITPNPQTSLMSLLMSPR
jgi:hypothetical protein